MTDNRRSGARLIIDALLANGIEILFTVPGESFLDLLDAALDVRNRLRVVTCRHEGGAAFMAEAYGKATGQPAALAVTRGPGATNASIGIHTAFQDSTPMVVIVGQVPRAFRGREAFQEVAFTEFFRPLASACVEVEHAADIPQLFDDMLTIATGRNGTRPGPVVVSVPEDVFGDDSDAADVAPLAPKPRAPDADQLAQLEQHLSTAEQPLVILGGSGWTARACNQIRQFVEAHDLPVATSFRRQDRLDNSSPSYAGTLSVGMDPALAEFVKDADLIIALGTRLGEIATAQYRLLVPPQTRQPLIHIHADANELGKVYAPTFAIHADIAATAAGLAELTPPAKPPWATWRAQLRAAYEASTVPEPAVGSVDLGIICASLSDLLPADSFVATDAGNFASWVQRYHRFGHYPSQLGPTNGAMGYGIPAVVAAKLAAPNHPAICFVGDGGAMMTGNELATAISCGLDPIIVIVNNGIYGTIRMHQETRYPGRISATDLTNPDFTAWAASFGAHAERVTSTAEFAPALERALAAKRAAVIEIVTDPEQITPRATISALQSRAAGAAK